MRSIVFSAKVPEFLASSRSRVRAALRYVETNIAFQLTYIVLSMKGVGRGRGAARSLGLGLAMVRRMVDSSRPSDLEISAGPRDIHKTFFSGLWCISPWASTS